MAAGIGTVTPGPNLQAVADQLVESLVSFPGDGIYPTGGTPTFSAVAGIATALHKKKLFAVLPQDCGGYHPVYDAVNDKLKVYYNDNNNASDGPAIEVPNATDLSGTTFNVILKAY